MPWTAASFKASHNPKLSTGRAATAAKIANAMLRKGAPEGEAIATANARAAGQKPKKHDKPFGALAP